MFYNVIAVKLVYFRQHLEKCDTQLNSNIFRQYLKIPNSNNFYKVGVIACSKK